MFCVSREPCEDFGLDKILHANGFNHTAWLMRTMELTFPPDRIPELASRYEYPRDDAHLVNDVGPTVREAGCYTAAQLQLIARWKSPRSAGRTEKNTNEYVMESTAAALSSENEKLKISILTLLDGVRLPTASTLLHFFDPTYPILDRRAAWSLGEEVTGVQLDVDFWVRYLDACRTIAAREAVSVRELDKALWQYSKESQGNLPL